MAYVVKVKVRTRGGIAKSQSIPLPSKERVERYIRLSPMIRANTNIRVVNTRTKKTVEGQRAKFYSLLGKYKY